MAASSHEAIPISAANLAQFTDRANQILKRVKWKPNPKVLEEEPKKPGLHQWRGSSVSFEPQESEVSILQTIQQISKDSTLLPEDANHVLNVLRRGIQISMHICSLYIKASNLESLVEQNKKSALSETQKAEFRAKFQTTAAIGLFTACYYVSWELGDYKSEKVSGINIDLPGLPEFTIRNPGDAFDCFAYYYGALLEKGGLVHSELELIKFTILYCRKFVEELKLRAGSLQYAEPFLERTYKLEESNFSINGFEIESSGSAASIEFNRVELSQIVGNRDAKHFAKRLAERLICYDPTSKKNPMFDLGGFSTVNLGHGEPGTGKSMIIAATATLLSDYCERLGLPFLFWPMPDTVVSTFQGGSAERMMNWMLPLRDASKVIYAPIDDAENNFEERTRQGVSAGVREVIAVFLRNTEGAYAINRGNTVIELYTNLPEQIDKAVMSRILRRTYIGGAKEWQEFLDQDYLWWKRYRELDPKLVNLSDPKDYKYLERQAQIEALAQVSGNLSEPESEQMKRIFAATEKEHSLKEHVFFAKLFQSVKAEYPFFTSRDARNIQRAVDGRLMDFDFPSEWLENPEIFFRQPYDQKMSMIKELMKRNMRGLSFAEIRLQEAIRYLEAMVRIADTTRTRRINELVEGFELQSEAQDEFVKNKQRRGE